MPSPAPSPCEIAGPGSSARSWRAGAASATLPIAVGARLDGYVARRGVATGTHDNLTVTALVLEHDADRLVVIAADVVAVDRSLVGEIAKAANVGADDLLVCASHTHSGPVGLVPRLHPSQPERPDPALRTRFVALCRGLVAEATARASLATLWLGQATVSEVAANRNDPDGPSDETVTVLGTRRADDSWQAIVVHFACHPTVLGAVNLLVSADFPGALRASLDRRWKGSGGPPVILFVNGAAGDVSTRFTRHGQGFDEVERLGRLLADGTEQALASARPIGGPFVRQTASVSLRPTSPRCAALDAAEVVRRGSGGADRRAVARAEGTALAGGLPAGDGAPVRVTLVTVRLGDLALVGVPGELLAGLGRRIVAGSPFATTLVVGYANGYVGYLVDEDAVAEETYEALASPFAGDAGTWVVEVATALLERLAASGAGGTAPAPMEKRHR